MWSEHIHTVHDMHVFVPFKLNPRGGGEKSSKQMGIIASFNTLIYTQTHFVQFSLIIISYTDVGALQCPLGNVISAK